MSFSGTVIAGAAGASWVGVDAVTVAAGFGAGDDMVWEDVVGDDMVVAVIVVSDCFLSLAHPPHTSPASNAAAATFVVFISGFSKARVGFRFVSNLKSE